MKIRIVVLPILFVGFADDIFAHPVGANIPND